jgi:hypothetical protein
MAEGQSFFFVVARTPGGAPTGCVRVLEDAMPGLCVTLPDVRPSAICGWPSIDCYIVPAWGRQAKRIPEM